jgi:hypothetical protein
LEDLTGAGRTPPPAQEDRAAAEGHSNGRSRHSGG